MRLADRWNIGRFAEAHQAAAASGAADLASCSPGILCRAEDGVDLRCRDARREALAVFPLLADLPPDLIPGLALERVAHRHGDVANARKALLDVAIAVDMALGHFPVVDTGVAGRPRVGEHQALLKING